MTEKINLKIGDKVSTNGNSKMIFAMQWRTGTVKEIRYSRHSGYTLRIQFDEVVNNPISRIKTCWLKSECIF